jgi:hypothetical protein
VTDRFTVRGASPADGPALTRLAALDSKPLPRGRLLVADVDGELWAAVALDGLRTVADPFRPSGELVLLLRERARQLERSHGGARRGRLRAIAVRLRRAPEAPLGESA